LSRNLNIEDLNRRLEEKSPQQVLEWALSEFHPKISLASSFGAEDMVMTDMLRNINPDARIFALETGRLHQETYDLIDKAREKYGDFEIFYPDTAHLEEMTRNHGLNLFYKSMTLRKMCCGVRKVEPLTRALSDLDAWITGLRRDQASTRVSVQKVEVDAIHNGIIKINPLADQTSEDVWRYIRKNNVPYNALHDNGYPSIGCEPCTRAVKPGEDPRAGRWWWEPREASECGLHKK
jgi:phosphoadenosine phosphosulfate reductase